MSENTACTNIGSDGVRVRTVIGVLLALFSLFLALMLVTTGVSRWLRFLLFPTLWGTFISFFQARARTCVFLVARGKRDMGHQREDIVDQEELARLQRRAGSIQMLAFTFALATTLLSMLLPTSLPLPEHWQLPH
tara:strand:+ start:82 stop:486 length:405 start_codon:yes stop_codon:yes gene_type:complete